MNKKVGSRLYIKVAPLERRTPRSSVTHRSPLEHPIPRSSGGCTLPELLQTRCPLERQTPRSSVRHILPLEQPTPRSSVYHCRRKYWMGDFPARAPTPPLERTSNNRVPLERQKHCSSGGTKNRAKISRFKTQPTYSLLAQHNPKLEHKEKRVGRG
mgnify:CR=1 FL=1